MTNEDQSVRRVTCDSNPVFRRATESHFSEIRSLLVDRLGGSQNALDNWLENTQDDTRPESTVVALDSGSVVGFGAMTLCSTEYAQRYAGFDVPLSIRREPVGILHMSAVSRTHESEGIGTKLFNIRLQYLIQNGVKSALGIAWHRKSHHDSRSLFEKFGFSQFETWERYYARTNRRGECPDCSDGCSCSASLYAKNLEFV